MYVFRILFECFGLWILLSKNIFERNYIAFYVN